MTDDSFLPFSFPAIGRKKVTAAFDGGRLSSDGGVMLLAQAERRLGLAERLAAVIPDGRDQSRVTHLLPDILRARIFAIACGYEDADDTARPVAVILRPGKTPSGKEVRGHLRRLVRRLRKHWPHTHLTIRGDGHYSRPEVMAWCEDNDIDFVFGLPGNAILAGAVEAAADDIRTRRALDQKPALRGFADTRSQPKSWKRERRPCARIEATTKGLDIRFVVTSLHTGSAEHVYETLYCARGQAENLIKLHKAQLRPHQLPPPVRQPDAADPA